MSHRYNLEPYKGMSTRHRCPECKKNKVFALYIDTDTNESVDPNKKTGRCNRESGCGYHYTPKQYLTDNGIEQEYKENEGQPEKPKAPIAYIDKDVFTKSLTGYAKNKFVMFLHTLFDGDTVQSLISSYNIGSSGTWPGATTFWYVDNLDRINYGKIMVYDHVTGKRDKVKNNHCANVLEKSLNKTGQALPEWLVKYQQNETKINCLFGEHLLKVYPQKPVAIVESEKTAIIASVYLPQFIWLACGSLGNLSPNRCKSLAGRSVTLYPDLNAFDKWSAKGSYLKYKVSSILESHSTEDEKKLGLDIADYLVKVSAPEKINGELPDQDPIKDNPMPSAPIDKNLREPETLQNSSGTLDLIELRQYYQDLEDNGLIPDQHRSHIGTLWQGVMIYKHHPPSLKLYTDPLIQIRTEIETLNKTKIAI